MSVIQVSFSHLEQRNSNPLERALISAMLHVPQPSVAQKNLIRTFTTGL
jgi:hypothetical protein